MVSKTADPIRLLVVDDHFVVRSGLTASLDLERDLQVVAEAEAGEQVEGNFRCRCRRARHCLPPEIPRARWAEPCRSGKLDQTKIPASEWPLRAAVSRKRTAFPVFVSVLR